MNTLQFIYTIIICEKIISIWTFFNKKTNNKMNITLALLNIGVIGNSPFTQFSHLSTPSSFYLSGSQIIRSTTNFFVSTDLNRNQYKFASSRFIQFLKTPLSISSLPTITKNNEIFHTTLEHYNSNLTVTNCQFIRHISGSFF